MCVIWGGGVPPPRSRGGAHAGLQAGRPRRGRQPPRVVRERPPPGHQQQSPDVVQHVHSQRAAGKPLKLTESFLLRHTHHRTDANRVFNWTVLCYMWSEHSHLFGCVCLLLMWFHTHLYSPSMTSLVKDTTNFVLIQYSPTVLPGWKLSRFLLFIWH